MRRAERPFALPACRGAHADVLLERVAADVSLRVWRVERVVRGRRRRDLSSTQATQETDTARSGAHGRGGESTKG